MPLASRSMTDTDRTATAPRPLSGLASQHTSYIASFIRETCRYSDCRAADRVSCNERYCAAASVGRILATRAATPSASPAGCDVHEDKLSPQVLNTMSSAQSPPSVGAETGRSPATVTAPSSRAGGRLCWDSSSSSGHMSLWIMPAHCKRPD